VALTISAIVPTYNEANTIEAAVARARQLADEVLVVDAKSPDGTGAIAARAGATVIESLKGRGAQLHCGGENARGDVLLFLHADVDVPMDARAAILRALEDPAVIGGNFLLRFMPDSRAARFFSWANDARRRWLRIYYGDSAIFVRRDTYRALGGFRAMPLFEDYEFARRLERHGRTSYVRDVVVTASARRFESAPVRTLLLWSALQILYSAGVPVNMLARAYSDLRPQTDRS